MAIPRDSHRQTLPRPASLLSPDPGPAGLLRVLTPGPVVLRAYYGLGRSQVVYGPAPEPAGLSQVDTHLRGRICASDLSQISRHFHGHVTR
jgi:hypothetical protein